MAEAVEVVVEAAVAVACGLDSTCDDYGCYDYDGCDDDDGDYGDCCDDCCCDDRSI